MKLSIIDNYRGIAVEPSFWDLANRPFDPEQFVSFANRIHANAIRVGFFGHTGLAYFQSKIAPHAPGLGGRDLLREFQECCEKYNLKLVPYINTHFDKTYYEEHPESLSLPGGKPGFVPGTPLVKVCLNNPDYRNYTFSVAEEIVREYDLDVLYIDSLKLEHLCECEWCKKLLAEQTGLSVPKDSDWGGDDWEAYMSWYHNRYLELAKMCADNARKSNPNLKLISNRESFFNHITSTPEFNATVAHDVFDCIHAEAAVRLCRETFSHITSQGLFGQAMDTNIWLWAEYCLGRWVYRSCSNNEITLKIAKIISTGSRPNLWSLTDMNESSDHAAEGIAQVYSMIEKYPECFDQTKTVADTAQLYSTRSRQYYVKGLEPLVWPYAPDRRGKRYEAEFLGLSRLELFNHLQSTYVLDDAITASELSAYKTLVLPNVGSMSDEQCQAVREYVKHGGSLLATYETSLYDSDGKIRDDFGLADLFGASYTEEGPETGDFDSMFLVGGYLQPTADNVLGIDQSDMQLASGCTLKVQTITAQTAATFLYPGGYHLDFNVLQEGNPGILCNTYGKGKVAYLPFELGYGFNSEDPLAMVEFFGKLMSWLRDEEMVETNLPPVSDVFVRETFTGDYVVHLINLPADRPIIVDNPQPLINVEVKLQLPKAITDCELLDGSGATGVTWTSEENITKLKFEQLTNYAVVRCKVK